MCEVALIAIVADLKGRNVFTTFLIACPLLRQPRDRGNTHPRPWQHHRGLADRRHREQPQRVRARGEVGPPLDVAQLEALPLSLQPAIGGRSKPDQGALGAVDRQRAPSSTGSEAIWQATWNVSRMWAGATRTRGPHARAFSRRRTAPLTAHLFTRSGAPGRGVRRDRLRQRWIVSMADSR